MATTKRTLSVEVLEDRQLCAVMGMPNGPMPQFPYPADRTGDVKNLIGSPGGSDSEWLDLGAPTMQKVREREPVMSVQYRETDYNFATRLMEEEGIFYQREAAGQSNFEIYDYPGEYAQRDRVKVQSPWDRPSSDGGDSSSWVRVGTPWAGKQWGMIHIPRIGQEVIIGSIGGDPDRPVVHRNVNIVDYIDEDEVNTPFLSARPPLSHRLYRPFAMIESDGRSSGTEVHGRLPGPLPEGIAVKDRDIEVDNDETHWVRIR